MKQRSARPGPLKISPSPDREARAGPPLEIKKAPRSSGHDAPSPTTAAFRHDRFGRVLITTWVTYAAYTMARRPFAVARGAIAADLQLSISDCVAVDTAFLAMYTVGQFVYGPVQKRVQVSARDTLFAGLLISCLSLATLIVATDAWQIVIAWAVLGFVQAVGWASCLLIVTPWLGSSERGGIMGLWGSMTSSGAVLGNVLTPTLIRLSGSWRGGLTLFVAILAAISLVGRWFIAKHPNTRGFLAPAQRASGVESLATLRKLGAVASVEGELLVQRSLRLTGAPASPAKKSNKPLWRRPGVAGLCASYFCSKLVRYVLALWLPYYFTDVLRFDAATAGFVASCFDAGGVAGAVLSGYASDGYRQGKRRSEFVMLLSVALAVALTGFSLGSKLTATSAYFAAVVTLVAGAFAYAVDAVITGSLMQDFAERGKMVDDLASLSGLVGAVGTLGSVLQGPLTAFVTAHWSWPVLFATLQGASLLAAMALIPARHLEFSTS